MLAYIPVRFELYRTVPRHLHWTLQNLIGFADRAGKCWPSCRTLAAATGTPRSTISRHLQQLAAAGVIARQRRPGGVYAYTIAVRFLPANRAAAREVSHSRDRAVPPARTEENPPKKTSALHGDSEDRVRWERRLRSWHHSGGKFWNAFWGPKPTEAGCFVPVELLQ